jgi:hypothetical protein
MSSSAVIKLSSYSRAERDVSIPSGSKWGRMPHQRSLRFLLTVRLVSMPHTAHTYRMSTSRSVTGARS